MSEKLSPKSAAERKRAQRQRMRERGEPSIAAFDSALREAVFSSYQAGRLQSIFHIWSGRWSTDFPLMDQGQSVAAGPQW
jgi:hypothetical protein